MSKWLFIILLLSPAICANKSSFQFIVFWNVGQGQWITAITPDLCLHYDFGGEQVFLKMNKNLFLKLCKSKQNVLHLSHPDLDHYGYYNFLVNNAPNICWAEIDHTQVPLNRLSRKISICNSNSISSGKRIYKPKAVKSKNDSSQIYTYNSVLIPGDSSKKQEKIWAQDLQKQKLKILVLGHHGSRTSTSDFLLSKLPDLKMTIVQSRKAKYNHPHFETLARLKKNHTPLIRTEDWGNIAIRFE